MLPIAPLMIEHRLIEKMVSLLTKELSRLQAGGQIDLEFNRRAVDFFRVYADQTHHGKEEEILFRELKKKDLSDEHKAVMEQLTAEHVEARQHVGALLAARSKDEAIAPLKIITALYPRHIALEDKQFFIPVMDYFTEQEKAALLQEGKDFDASMIHKKYKAAVAGL